MPDTNAPTDAAVADTLLPDQAASGRPPASSAGASPGVSLSDVGAPATLNPDQVRYGSAQELGRGGMGVVQLRTDTCIGRDVAIKTLHRGLAADPQAATRFLREARIQGQLEHPSIVPVYDLGRAPNGEIFFTMKQIRGRTLRRVLRAVRAGETEKEPRFSTRRLLEAFRQVCLAVDFAHRRGVIHRDLKPDNVMLGEFGEVYVLDWGIARIMSEPADADDEARWITDPGFGDENQTRQGALLGTPGYMSPEQARGAVDAIDATSDVWSLGAILFEILTGEVLLAPGPGPAATLAATMLGELRLERLEEVTSPELASLCRRALAVDKAERLSSARALSDAVEAFLDGDRDKQARLARAAEHAARAEEAAARAFAEEDHALRVRAGREAGRALGFDPENQSARRTLLTLIQRPPREMPEEAREAWEASRARVLKTFYREGLLSFLVYVPVLAFFAWRGVDEMWVHGVATAATLAFTALSVFGLARPLRSPKLPFLLAVMVAVILVCMTRLFSPVLVVPILAAMNAVASMIYADPSTRRFVGLVGASVVVVPALCEAIGLWPPTMAVHDGSLVLTGRLMHLPDGPWMLAAVVALTGVPILLSTFLISRVRQKDEEAIRAAHLQRWQLAQLVAPG